jgi:hypothetical protein
MTRQHLPYYAIAAAILVVGLVALGVPINNVLFVGLIFACPLMMMFMMRGMGAGNKDDSNRKDDSGPKDRDHDMRAGH